MAVQENTDFQAADDAENTGGITWKTISPDAIIEAIDNLSVNLRPSSVYLTHQFGMRISRYKEDELLWAQGVATNFASHILADVWTNLNITRTNRRPFPKQCSWRVVRCSSRYVLHAAYHARLRKGEFVVFLRSFLEASKDKRWMKGSSDQVLSFTLYKYYNSRKGFTDKDYRITSALRQSVFDLCARCILFWSWHVADFERKVRHETQGRKADKTTSTGESQVGGKEGESADQTSADAVKPVRYSSPVTRFPGKKHLSLLYRIIRTYRTWTNLTRAYKHAGKQQIAFGRYKGKMFLQVRSRELRRLEERLPDVADIEKMREDVLILLNRRTSSASRVKQAEATRHFWRRRSRYRRQRSVRVGYLERSQSDPRGPKVQLRELLPYELERYYNELTQMLFARRQMLQQREHLKTFLRDKPPSFPSVEPTPEQPRELRMQKYQTDLEWFADPFPSSASPIDWHKYSPGQLEQFENQAKAKWLRSTGAIKQPKLHPLIFSRTMYPAADVQRMASFSILYWKHTPTREELERKYRRRVIFGKTKKSRLKRRVPLLKWLREKRIARDLARGTIYRYVLAVDVHGKSAFKDYKDGRPYRSQRPRREVQAEINPRMRRHFFFVNYPATPFSFPRRSSIMLFPLEITSTKEHDALLHGDQLLQSIIQRQLRAQQQKYEQQSEKPIEHCLPEPVLTSSLIVSEVDAAGHPSFYLQLPVEYAVPPIAMLPRKIIAFHEDENGYHYAVITVTGHIVEVGDVVMPSNVRRQDGEIDYSEPYVHELANAMVALANSHNAFVGLEDTSARKNRPTTSRKQNRELFANPFGKLVEFLSYKALQAGLPIPHLTRGVRYRDACGQCGPALPAGTATIHRGPATACTMCHAARPGTFVSVPVLLHPAAIIYQVPGVEQLQLSGQTLANIFLGAITRWDHTEIAADNPGVQLPDLPITVIRESDDPITVTVVSNYLGNVSPEWSRRASTRKRLLWTAKEDQSTTPIEVVREIEGAIGIVAWRHELEHESGIVAIKNNAGTFVTPSSANISTANMALVPETSDNESLILPNPDNNSNIYPIIGVTWMSMSTEQMNWQQAYESVNFLYWVLTEGSQQAIHQGYFPAPESVRNLAVARLQHVSVGGQFVFKQEDSVSQNSSNISANDHPVHATVIRLTGVGAASPIPLYQQWSEPYRHIAPHANIVFQRVPPHLEDASVIRRQTTRRNTARFDRRVDNQNRPTCTVCGTVWPDGDGWSDCIRCGTAIEAQYNRSIVIARKTLEQLVDRYQIVVERRKVATEDLLESDELSLP